MAAYSLVELIRFMQEDECRRAAGQSNPRSSVAVVPLAVIEAVTVAEPMKAPTFNLDQLFDSDDDVDDGGLFGD